MTQQTRHFALEGGLDLVTPAIRMPSGRAISAQNYEPVLEGYRRCDGFERYDGNPKPSEATYYILDFDAGVAAISEGDTVTGATSGATGVALIDAVVETGSYGGSDAAGFLVLTNISGTFQDNEDLQVSAATKCVADGSPLARGAANDTDDTTYIRDAIETARSNISTIPGSGRIRGVWVYDGDVYAFRDNAGGTAGVMYKATSSGWVAQSFGSYIKFDAGTAEFTEGDTLTGGTSGATATIERVCLRTGAWDGSGEGILVLSGITGTFQDNETITDGSSGSATSNGTIVSISLSAGGRYDFVNHNFFGASNLRRMYFVNGQDTAFEWDGSVLVPIFTGMDTDTPAHIAAHKNHLFLAFPGGSAQHSGIGDPYAWTPVLGAAEIGLGEEITGFLQDYAKVLVLLGRNVVAILYGNDSTDWQLDKIANDAGAIEWTAQVVGRGLYMDDQGVRDLRTTQAYGDFTMGTLTRMVKPWLDAKKKAGVTPIASLRVRAKDQYRIFFSDGTGLFIYLGKKQPEILPFDLGKVVYCCCSAEDASGDEVLFFGSDDGYVYELDAGTSFDGSEIDAHLRLPFNHTGSPTRRKRWHKATLELDAAANTTLGMTSEFGYADPNQPAGQEQSFSVRGGGGFWNELNWNDFYWSSPVEGLAEAHIDGIGNNISIVVISDATYEDAHTIHGLTLHYSNRGLVR